MSDILFAQNAWDDYLTWQSQDKKTLKKINSLLKEIQRHPFEGEGKPEPLSGNLTNAWSRRINDKDRLVYRFEEDKVIVLQCKGHYNDK